MQDLRWLLVCTVITVSAALTGCGGSGSSSSVASNPSDPVQSSPETEDPPLPSAPDGAFCSEMVVDFSESPRQRITGLPGKLQHLVKNQVETALSQFSQVNLASRSPAIQESGIIPRGEGFATIHGNVINNDQVDLVIPGNLELEWTVEDNLYQPEGVTSGDVGYYGTHVFPVSGTDIDFSMIALDKNSGARNWVVRPGQIGQGGTPMILNNPETGGKTVYSGGLRGVFALDERGNVSWCTNTGLGIDAEATSDFNTHIKKRLWGMNYHQPTDSLIAVYGDGTVIAFARETGEIRAQTRIDGDPSVDDTGLNLPAPILEGAEKAIRKQFVPEGAQIPDDARIFNTIIAVALGGDMVVSNYYATDPDSDRIWVAATLPDAADGVEDGVARFGALHALNLNKEGENYAFSKGCSVPFEGGSASTPAVLPGGKRIYTSDKDGNALAFNHNCELIWSVNVGDQILGSLAVSPYDNYVYAATGSGVFQIIDKGNSGELGWSADLDDIFHSGPLLLTPLQVVSNALKSLGVDVPVEVQASNIEISTISENALVLIAGMGLQMDPDRSEVFAPLVMSVTSIDRMTGSVISSTPAREESIAVIGVDGDGSVVIGNSPLRRGALVGVTEIIGDGLIGKALADIIPPLSGGVTKYSPSNNIDIAARDAICFAARKVLVWEVNQSKVSYGWFESPESTAFSALIKQGRSFLSRALQGGQISNTDYSYALFALADAEENIAVKDYRSAHSGLMDACQQLH